MVVEERIIEEEQSVRPQYDSNYDYATEISGEKPFQATGNGNLNASSTLNAILTYVSDGNGIGIGFGNLTRAAGDFVASGNNSTNVTASLITGLLSFSSDGVGIGDGKASLVGFVRYISNGINDTFTSANISNPIDASASGLVQGLGNATRFEYITALVGNSLGIGDGSTDINVEAKTTEELQKREESFFIGNVEIPLLVSKDTSVGRETVTKEFIRDNPQFFQESANFESGTYSAYLNQENHSESKTLEEQIKSIRNLLERKPQENKISYANGEAYVVVNSVGDVIDVDEEIKEVEIDLIILESV